MLNDVIQVLYWKFKRKEGSKALRGGEMPKHFLALAMFAALAWTVSAQTIPNTMSECEGSSACCVWTFDGMKGTGRWPHGAFASLIIDRFDAGSVVIRRADTSGFSAGLTAVYIGNLHRTRVDGSVTWTWPGHWNNKPATGKWYATFVQAPEGSPEQSSTAANNKGTMNDGSIAPPKLMHWCAQHCSTWTLDTGPPFDKPHYGSVASGQIVVVESFTRESVVMKRSNYGRFSGTAVLNGQLSSDGNSIVNGTITWMDGRKVVASYPFQAAWGSALSSVPGSDEERDRRAQAQAAPAQPSNDTAAGPPSDATRRPPARAPSPAPRGPGGTPGSVPSTTDVALPVADPLSFACPNYESPEPSVSAFEALQKAEDFAHKGGDDLLGVSDFGHTPEALTWYCKSAAAGNGKAAYEIGHLFEDGYAINSIGPDGRVATTHVWGNRGVAFYWFHLAASRGYSRAMIRVSQYYFAGTQYMKGSGVEKDVNQALEWATKAGNSHDTEAEIMLAVLYKPGAPGDPAVAKREATASMWLNQAYANLISSEKVCRNPRVVDEMISQLPVASFDRSSLDVHVRVARGDSEQVCVLSLGERKTGEADTMYTEIARALGGGMVNSWNYSVEKAPGTGERIVRRETLKDALMEKMMDFQTAFNALKPLMK
jgi:hypothetical protein